MEITKPGIYDGLPMADYIADPCPEPSLSRGAIERLVMSTPAHMEEDHPRMGGGGGGSNKAADLGSAAHGVLLGGDERIVWVEIEDKKNLGEMIWAPNFTTNAAKAVRDDAHAAGDIPMLDHQRRPLEDMVGIAREFLKDLTSGATGKAEQTVIWKEGDDWARCRPDWFASELADIIVDYKTTGLKGGPDKFIANMMKPDKGYDIGARWQTRGIDALKGKTSRDFVFMVQESFKPYCCFNVALTDHMAQIADEKIAFGLKLWRECQKAEQWPGYNSAVHYAEPATFSVFDWEARKAQLQMTPGGA